MPRQPTVAEHVLDGAALLYKRPDSDKYQVRFKIGRRWIVRSTGESNRQDALEKTREMYFTMKYAHKAGLPIVSKTFESVAKVVAAELKKAANGKKTTEALYAGFLERMWIPFLGKTHIHSITTDTLKEFDKWRTETLGRQPKLISVKQHNVALQKVFERAVDLKLISHNEIPRFHESGEATGKRPSFTLDEYRVLYKFMRGWWKQGKTARDQEKRALMRDYVLVLANTGMRPGTETESLAWGSVQQFESSGKQYLAFTVSGKTGPRELVTRTSVKRFLDRIKKRATYEIKPTTEVFLLPNGKKMSQPPVLFKQLLTDAGLLVDPKTGKERTLYSLRHFFATAALVHRSVPLHTLARQMGTSTAMLEEFYSDLIPRMAAKQILG